MIDNLLEEYDEQNIFETVRETEKGAPSWIIRGIFTKAGVPNRNKRIYPVPVMCEAVEAIQPLVASGSFTGQLNHPEGTPKTDLNLISHKFTSLKMMDDGSGRGIYECVPAGPNKHNLEQLLEDKIGFGISTRATAKTHPYVGPLGEGLVEVENPLKLFAIDFVSNQSSKEATVNPVFEEEEHKIRLGYTQKLAEVWDSCFKK